MSRNLLLYGDKIWELDQTFTYTGEPQEFTLDSGNYLIECIGGKAGGIVWEEGFKPQYETAEYAGKAMGILSVAEPTTFYAMVGGDGVDGLWDGPMHTPQPGGWNGGGDSSSLASASGGGATDVRLNITPESIISVTKTLPNKYTALKYLPVDQYALGGNVFDTDYIVNAMTGVEIDCVSHSGATFGTMDYDKIITSYDDSRVDPETHETIHDWSYYFMSYMPENLPGHLDRFRTDVPDTSAVYSNTDGVRKRYTMSNSITEYDYETSETTTIVSAHGCGGAVYDWQPLALFGYKYKYQSNVTTYPYSQMDFYSFTIREDNIDIHKYIPVLDTDTDHTGLYDLCTDTYHDFDIPDINYMEMGVNVEATVDGITFKSEEGHYHISGRSISGNPVEYVFNLRNDCHIPKSCYYPDGSASLKFKNSASIPQEMTIEFRYNTTVVQSYTGGSILSWMFDDRYVGLSDATINNIRFVVSDLPLSREYDDDFAFMVTDLYPQSGDIPRYIKPGRFDSSDYLDTHTFSVQSVQRDSLNSRIIVAGGNGASNIVGGSSVGSAIHESPGGNNDIHNKVYATQTTGGSFGKAMPYIKTGYVKGPSESEDIRNRNVVSGAGGGWYGGYGIIDYNQIHDLYDGGRPGSGSSYVLTENSYKPDGYMNGYTASDYYMTHPLMIPYSNETSRVKIYTEVAQLKKDDKITVRCNGRNEKITLPPGVYHLACNGASGGQRETLVIESDPETELGGRVTGTLSLTDEATIYATVGGSAYDLYKAADVNITYPDALFPFVSYNGGGRYNGAQINNKSLALNGGGATDFRTIIPHDEIITYTIGDAFTELEYLENNDQCIINTEVYMLNDMEVEMDCIPYQSSWSRYEVLFGSRNGGSSGPDFEFFIRYNNNYIFRYQIGSMSYATHTPILDERIVLRSESNTLHVYKNGELQFDITVSTTRRDCVKPLGIYRLYQNYNAYSDPSHARIYSFKVFNSSNEILNYFVPCKTKNVDTGISIDFVQGKYWPAASATDTIRSDGYIDWPSGTSAKWLQMFATDVNDVPLEILVCTTNSSGTLIENLGWSPSGTTININPLTERLYIAIKYTDGSDITPEMLGNFSVKYIDGEYGLYDIINGTFHTNLTYTRNAVQKLTGGQPVAEPTIYTKTVTLDTEISLLSRFLVAGGSGGSGVTNYRPSISSDQTYSSPGAAGGGTSGSSPEKPTQLKGTNYGPGTQNAAGTGSDVNASGGFGYGGNASIINAGNTNAGYGAAGGGGWYGGSGTVPIANDINFGGAGGSGYVLTEDSYKPTGYVLDEKFWLTDTTNITGGCINERGFETAIIEISELLNFKFLITDTEGIKYFDTTNEQWELISGATEIDVALINEYGGYRLSTERGLVGEYVISILDVNDKFDHVDIIAVPELIVITATVTSPNIFDSMELDGDNLEYVDYDYYVQSLPENRHLINVEISMSDIPEKEPKLYNISLTSTQNLEFRSNPRKEKVYLPHVDLLTVGEMDRIPQAFNDYILPTLLDGTTVVGEIQYAEMIEYERKIYILLAINKSVLRFASFNLITKERITIFEVPMSELNTDLYDPNNPNTNRIGHFLFDENNVYLTSNMNTTNFAIIQIQSPHTVTNTSLTGTNIGLTGCFGQMCWINNYTIGFIRHRCIVYYDTRFNEVQEIIQTGDTDYKITMTSNDKFIVMTRSTSTTNPIAVFNKETKTTAYYATNGTKGMSVACYGEDNKFYVVQQISGGSDIICIYDGDNMTKLGEVAIPLTNTKPLSIQYENGLLYMLFANKLNVYICKLKEDYTLDLFRAIGIQYPIEDTLNSTGYNIIALPTILYPLAFKQYFMYPYFKLLTINFSTDAKYSLGYKYNRIVYMLTTQYESMYTYDPRFVTFRDTNATIHPGELRYPITDEEGVIKQVAIDRAYNKFINASFVEKEEENEDD